MLGVDIGDVLPAVIRIAENVFIVAFLGWVFFSDCSRGNPIRRYVVDRTRPAFVWLGMNSAGWRMFSPDPPLRTIWPRARLTMSDSSELFWEPDSFAAMSPRQKIAQKKFHTYYHQVVRPGVTPRALRDFVEYLLRTTPGSARCTRIEVYRVASPTPAHGTPETSRSATPSATLLFTFHPDPGADAI
jgi:hypothetical protein